MVTTEVARSRGPDEDRIFLDRLGQIAKRGAKDDRFRVLGEIAQGGMGRVLRVYDEDLRRELAMKVIRLGGLESPAAELNTETRENLALFLEEVQITGQLNHPSVVPVHDIGVNARGELYYIMPLLRGVDLKVGIERFRHGEPGWTLPRIIEVICRAAQAVEHAHQRGVVHRDLKPANIMIGELGEIWVLDWGLAQLERRPLEDGAAGVDSETHLLLRTGGLVGTPGYMAPEQVEGVAGATGPRSDVYALGAVLYHALTGEMPYASPPQSCAADTVVQRTLTGPPRRVHEIAPHAQPELVAICETAMQRDPHLRYASALAMANDLRAWLEGRVVSTYDVGALGAFRKWRRRNRAAARALDALAVVVSVGSVAIAIQQHRHALAAERSRLDEMRANHAGNMRAADLSIQDNDIREARRLLEACPKPMRGWEWHWLRSRTDAAVEVLVGHTENVLGLAIDAAGRRVASWDTRGAAWLWELDTHTSRRLELEHPISALFQFAAALHPNGTLLATLVGPARIDVTDVESSKLLRSHEVANAGLCALAWSPDGSALACGMTSGAVSMIDAQSGKPLCSPLEKLAIEPIGVQALCFEPHGRSLVVCGSATPPRLWRWSSTENATPLLLGDALAHCAAFSPDGTRVAVAGPGGRVKVFDAGDGSLVHQVETGTPTVSAVAFARDGIGLVAAGSDDGLHVWNGDSEDAHATLVGHLGVVHSLVRAGDSDTFVSCSVDGTLRIWRPFEPAHGLERIATPELLALSFVGPQADLCAVAADGRVATIQGTKVELRGEPVAEPLGLYATIDADRDQALLGDARGQLELRRLSDGGVVRSMRAFDVAVTAVALDVGGLCGAAGADDGTVLVFGREQADELLRAQAAGNGITTLAFSPAQRGPPRLALARLDGGLLLSEPFAGREIRPLGLNDKRIRALTWSESGDMIVAGAIDGTITLVDPNAFAPPRELVAHTEYVRGLWLAPSSTRLYSASRDATLRIWDPRNTVPLLTLPASDLALDTLAVDGTSGRIACGTFARGDERGASVLVWSLPPGTRSDSQPANE